jgi:hypothetical protein
VKQNPKVARPHKRFRIDRLEERIAPAIVGVQINGGGNTPNGNANGVPTTNLNPAGHAPPGQNP